MCVYLNVFDFLTASEMGSLHKPEFKSPAEERLIRKMAKMALNGYEIGIQRKIKPGDHIQTMAEKIQDTVVTKHPLNTDNTPSGENSRDCTLRRPINTNIDKVYKAPDPLIISIGDKIKETIMINHPASTIIDHAALTPPPPPLPCTPIPTLNLHSTPKRQCDFISKNMHHFDKSYNGSDYSSSEDSSKDKSETNYSDTLRKKKSLEKDYFLNEINNSTYDSKPSEAKFSNTLNKRKIFEKDTPKNNTLENRSKFGDKTNTIQDTWNKTTNVQESWNKTSLLEKSKEDIIINTALSLNDDQSSKKGLANNLNDNTLYTYKSTLPENNSQTNTNLYSDTTDSNDIKEIVNEKENRNDDNPDEVVVQRRQKKCIRNDDGRRDSHIIARPLSTMTAADVADGLYPVCHKCDKAIKR